MTAFADGRIANVDYYLPLRKSVNVIASRAARYCADNNMTKTINTHTKYNNPENDLIILERTIWYQITTNQRNLKIEARSYYSNDLCRKHRRRNKQTYCAGN